MSDRYRARARVWGGWITVWAAMLAAAAALALTATGGRQRLLVFAGATLAMTGVAHSLLGERFILAPLLRRAELPHLFGGQAFTRGTLRFGWHLATVAWWGTAALLFALAVQPPSPRAIARILSVTFAVSAAVACGTSRGRHLSWVAFLAVAVAAWHGAGA